MGQHGLPRNSVGDADGAVVICKAPPMSVSASKAGHMHARMLLGVNILQARFGAEIAARQGVWHHSKHVSSGLASATKSHGPGMPWEGASCMGLASSC